ncbi:MAG: TauD/TfdA family dioxygenase [Planctomycetia bacterium]|nr:TauD/TfdA family dioxygenase [Planctomycetia bacterium]
MGADAALARAIDDSKAWGAELAQQRSSWYRPLAPELVSHLLTRVAKIPPEPAPVTELRLTGNDRSAWSEHFTPALHDLESGRGFVIFDRLPVERLSEREATGLYWLIGQFLGEPMEQNVQGTLLYDVRDTGQDLASGARFSVTSYESSFHTDNSFGEAVLDYVGLLCLRTAKSGGASQNVSGHAVCRTLQRENPGVLEILASPFHVDRRGGVREGEAPTVRRPVVAWNDSELLIRYLRYWIEAGHDKAGEPLTADQRQALDTLDGVLQRPELRVEFELQPGQIYFINNRWILHNRTAFTDHPETELRRYLVRLWLQATT